LSAKIKIELKKKYEDLSKEELLDELVDKILENEKLRKEKNKLEKETEKLRKKLRFYENPNTPPSRDERKTKTKNNFISMTVLPVGKRAGYKGRTRKKKEPTHFLNSFQGNCLDCGRYNIPKEIREKVYEEIPEPKPIKIIKATWAYMNVSAVIVGNQNQEKFLKKACLVRILKPTLHC
jgi:hypothetical protein